MSKQECITSSIGRRMSDGRTYRAEYNGGWSCSEYQLYVDSGDHWLYTGRIYVRPETESKLVRATEKLLRDREASDLQD